jgi:hypothetical protein
MTVHSANCPYDGNNWACTCKQTCKNCGAEVVPGSPDYCRADCLEEAIEKCSTAQTESRPLSPDLGEKSAKHDAAVTDKAGERGLGSQAQRDCKPSGGA